MSYDEEIPTDFIRKNIDEDWDFRSMSSHKNITLGLIEDYPDLWDLDMLSLNPNLTEEFVLYHLDWNWNSNFLLYENENISQEFMNKFF